jgi:mono/diheme cytochrome c family protein
VRRVLIIFGGVAVLALLLLPATGQAQQGTPSTTAASPTPSPTPAPGGASATTAPAAGEEEVDGRQLYFNNCAACHGPDFNGTSNGPSLREVGGAAAATTRRRCSRSTAAPWPRP